LQAVRIASKSFIEQTVRPWIGGPFSNAIALHFGEAISTKARLFQIGCTTRSGNGGLSFTYHFMTTTEFHKTDNGWEAIADDRLRGAASLTRGRAFSVSRIGGRQRANQTVDAAEPLIGPAPVSWQT